MSVRLEIIFQDGLNGRRVVADANYYKLEKEIWSLYSKPASSLLGYPGPLKKLAHKLQIFCLFDKMPRDFQ